MTKRKHYDCIIAWAEGKEIEYFNEINLRWEKIQNFPLWSEDTQYRVVQKTVLVELPVELVRVYAGYRGTAKGRYFKDFIAACRKALEENGE
jgi:hypothetical protein